MLKSNREEEDKKAVRNAYKVRAFDAAIRAIASLDTPVRTVAEVKQLKGVGPGISKRIGVFLHGTHYCESPQCDISPEKAREEALKQELKVLQTVPGVGERTARQLFDAGCTTVADMSKPSYFSILSSAQQIGLRFAAHLSQPVTCDEAETVANFVRENIPSRFEVHLAGS
ncbi:hypothetical protein SERLADRAFT_393026 [Serpula lacrymans var. lacrymans S7.9]|nr:uncharacterized protein SERLADRAFT_393026 [Serpula lacrymans var. lacrymans S7.9]EGO24108.1 hypothetical protein SERLADRAFT_393026 [Serpula lacrymans var. lacrymans S7.9]